MTELSPSSEPISDFTPDQLEALQAGGQFADTLQQLAASHLPEGFNPHTDALPLSPDATDLDKAMARAGIVGITHIVDNAQGSHEVWNVACHVGDPDPRPLHEQLPDELLTDAYAAYHQLPTDYLGAVSHGPHDGHMTDVFSVYRVEGSAQPPIEHGGIIVSAHAIDTNSQFGGYTIEPEYRYSLLDTKQIEGLSAKLDDVFQNGTHIK